MQATLANMRKHYTEGVIAWSPTTGEEYSADPGDYFMLGDDDMLKDDGGEPMLLVHRVECMVEVTEGGGDGE
jgi:hypothetical protein